MFAVIAAIILFLAAFGVKVGAINLLFLALAFWALHHAFAIAIPMWRNRTPG